MNTIDELINIYKLPIGTAKWFIDSNIRHINELHGINKITDIRYIDRDTKEIELTCNKCGNKKYKIMRKGHNKYAELSMTCICQKKNKDDIDSYIGQRFEMLTVIGFEKVKNRNYAKCLCDCGNVKLIQLSNLKTKKIKSCGCLAEKLKKEKCRTKSPLYATWAGMRQRCNNPNSGAYPNYGGRGITVCSEWDNNENGFENFEEWGIRNGYRPHQGLSLDRIDVNKGYSPDNCRFASVYIQNVNQRQRKQRKAEMITIDGVSKTKLEWYEHYKVWGATVNYRMKHMGMTFEEALKAEKKNEGNHHPKLLDIDRHKKNEIEKLNRANSYIEVNFLMAYLRSKCEYEIEPQVDIDGYKADFVIESDKIIVECDGYDYHKTKEQMQSDYERERYFVKCGYTVVRFTGSEINRDPDKCVNELLEIVRERHEIRQTDNRPERAYSAVAN